MPTPLSFPHGDLSWLEHDRFGLFIHWGIYALPGRHEWVKQVEEISDADYQKYFDRFDPDLYDPELWADAAADAGMKFFMITTKHHDGFCLWDSKLTDYKVTNTPYGKDTLHPMVDAFRARDMKVGLYYSLIDWRHPQFTIDSTHSMRNHPDRVKLNESRDQQKYIDYMHGQVRELCTDFGKVDAMFFDFSYKKKFAWPPGMEDDWQGKGRDEWDSPGLMKMLRELQPQMIVNDRLDLLDVPGGWDFRTPEQFEPEVWPEVDGQRVPWAAVQTFSGSWGYHRDEATWKSVPQLLQGLIRLVSKGGSLVLNVGPTGRGEFDARALDRLRGMGKWMKRHGRSIYGCTAAPDDLTPPRDCCYTYNPDTNRLYAHLFTYPVKHLHLPDLGDRVEYAQLLHDASEVGMGLGDWYAAQQERWGGSAQNTLSLELPVVKPDVAVPVVELFLKD